MPLSARNEMSCASQSIYLAELTCQARSSMRRGSPSRRIGRSNVGTPTGSIQIASAGSDSKGRFVLPGVDPLAELTYKARLGRSATRAGVVARAEAALTKPIVLSISPRHSIL